jgi:hypothetical protein
MILGEAGVQHDILETLEPRRADFGHSSHGLELEYPIANDSQLTASFRHEHGVVGKERDRPRLLESPSDHHHA